MAETFAYKVRDRGGKLLEGTLEADSQQLLIGKLRSMGYMPIDIQQQNAPGMSRELKMPFFSTRVKLKDVAVMSRQFATMINSGLALLRALNILAEQTESKPLAAIINQVRIDVEKGSSLSAALSRHPKAFSRLYVAMVRAGEVGGVLDSVLLRLAETIEKQVELRRKVRSAMTYPIVVMVLVLLIVTAMLLFIIPMFKGLYTELGGTLPLPDEGPARHLVVRAHVLVRAVRQRVRRLLGLPPLDQDRRRPQALGRHQAEDARDGPARAQDRASRFSRTLSALVRSGVPILESLDIVAETSGNHVVSVAVLDTQFAVKSGEPMSQRLERHPVFPPMVVQMMAVGEETGALDEMLDKIADFYDQEVEATVEALTSLIEPLLIVVMGAAVGGMVISLYLPMFNIIKLIK